MSNEILVFADWAALENPTLIGYLRSSIIKTREHFSFAYDDAWLSSEHVQQIDPDLQLYGGEQHAGEAQNFRTFLDSCPDRWGRLLMKRREAVRAHQDGRKPLFLQESDYLLGVHDLYRMGALRFKRTSDGPFLDDDAELAAPPITRLRELEHAAQHLEEPGDPEDPEYRRWLFLLMSPGSALGGARPKSCVVDEDEQLWIAKFPSRQDEYDVGAWEYVTYELALNAGIAMASSQIQRFNSEHHTFITQRFDRLGDQRLHFTSAMTQLGYYDGDYEASYLELAQFITENGSNTVEDLKALWRRIVFSIAVSNTDDHLRNHGFLFEEDGWTLSPAYDINPVAASSGLHLFITDDDNRLDYSLAMDVIDFFRIPEPEAITIRDEVLTSVSQWRKIAKKVGLSRAEQEQMVPAFNV